MHHVPAPLVDAETVEEEGEDAAAARVLAVLQKIRKHVSKQAIRNEEES